MTAEPMLEPGAARDRLEARGRRGHPRAALRARRPDHASTSASPSGEHRGPRADRDRLRADGQDDRWRAATRRADAHRRRAGPGQDDDGPPDGPQHGRLRPGDRALRLLRARRGVPHPAHGRHGVGAQPPAPEVGRGEDPGRQEGGREQLHGLRRERDQRAKLGANPRLRPSLERIARYGSNLFLMRGTATASRPSRTCARSSASIAARRRAAARPLRRLPPEGAGHSRSRPTRPRRSPASCPASRTSRSPRGAGRRDRGGRPRGPEGQAPAQPPPARLVGHQLRVRHHPDPERQVPHRRQGQHRVQSVPGAALPRLGRGHRSRRTAAARTTSTSSTRSSSNTAASIRPAGSRPRS